MIRNTRQTRVQNRETRYVVNTTIQHILPTYLTSYIHTLTYIYIRRQPRIVLCCAVLCCVVLCCVILYTYIGTYATQTSRPHFLPFHFQSFAFCLLPLGLSLLYFLPFFCILSMILGGADVSFFVFCFGDNQIQG